jgi:hypothetical protein
MLVRTLDQSLDTWVYNEDHPLAFDHYRIKSAAVRKRLVETARCKWVVFKPLCDCQNVDLLMDAHPDCKVIWVYRRYQDVADSALRRFGRDHQLRLIEHAATDPDWDHWLIDRMSDQRRELVRKLYHPGMSVHSAAALKWYLRNEIYFDFGLDRRPDQVRLVCYENLACDPVTEFRALFGFLGIAFDPAYVAHVVDSSVAKTNLARVDSDVQAVCEDTMNRLHVCRLNPPQTSQSAKDQLGQSLDITESCSLRATS